jgi:Predicted ABC-type transport system involved in lysophospholipase L1 biosynthesis, permease component
MRPLLSLKTLLRAPFKTLMMFLLIAVASFAVFSRVADYAVTQREMARATGYYRGVAALDNGVPNTAMLLASFLPNTARYSYYMSENAPPAGLTAEQIGAFSTLPGVSSTDIRYMTAGIIDGLKRVVRYGSYITKYDYTDRFVIEGTFTGCSIGAFGSSNINKINLTDCNPLTEGLPIAQGSNVSVVAFANNGTIVLTRGDMRVFFVLYNNPFDQSFVDGLTEGDRCLIIGRWDPRHFIDRDFDIMSLFIGDQDTIHYCDSFWLLNDKPENYLETDEFARVREIIDITNRDLKTFDMVYTSDMLAIPRFNERKMVIQEGRALTKADTDSCVVNFSLLELNGLKIGDRLTVALCDKLLLQHEGMGATAVIHERYGAPVKTVALEIVGAYADADAQYERNGAQWWSYSPNTIFVPLSLLPVEPPDNHEIKPGEFSVVIDDAFKMEAFLDAAEPLAKDLGVKLRFSDSGWLKVKDSVNTSQTASLITTGLYLGAAAVALLLAAYLYIGREAKSYAIMRALGTPRNKARNALALPLAALSALAIPAGGVAGMVYASKTISSALGNLAAAIEQYVPDASLPVGTMAACLLCEAAFLLLLCALFMRKLAKTPPLALLQGDAVRVKAEKTVVQTMGAAPIPKFVPSFSIGSDMPKRGGYGAVRHVTRYILRHTRRAGWKTALAVLLAVLLTGAMGLLAVTRLSYQELFDKTKIVGTISNYSSSAVMEASKSELMEDFYYSGGFSVICNDIPSNTGYLLALTNDIDRYVQSASPDEYVIEYAEGCDSSFFSESVPQCLIGGNMANQYGVKPGDSITLLSWERYFVLSTIYEDDEELVSQIKQSSLEFKVAGVITSEDFHVSVGIFAPISETVEKISEYVEYPFPVEFGEFVLPDKENPYGLRDYLGGLARVDSKYMEAVSYNLDTTELDNVKRVRDMLILLFPIAAAAAVLIGLIATGLIIMRSAKEAAVLRMLGTTKLRARCMLAIEQIALCVIGLAIAASGLVIYNAGLFVRSADTLALCGALYILGCAGAAAFAAESVTRRKVLELLQVKE